ncbi:MAG: HAMP domain-containing histidine kinase [Erysipelotrichaceae bacterium]|nr:HAMP domain-containing histidine kinase [Erysipelotrichaceae bacterium]
MKFNFKGIRFSTWLYFLGFSLSIMILLGLLLVLFIKPYYRNDRLKTVDAITETMESLLLKEDLSEKDLESAARTVIGNNVCAIIYNENGKSIYYPPDSLGQLCMLDKQITIGEKTFIINKDPGQFIDIIKNENPFSMTMTSPFTDIEMLLYGKQVKTNLANYYLILNTPLEPVESYIDFILNQYAYFALIVIAIALILALFLSRNISSPIVRMKDEANKLAQGNYDVQFRTDSFSEINDLASTLDDATEKLSKVNDLRKDLIANVSHDIKTPLTMIKAYAEMIKDISGEDPVKRDEHLNVIIQESDYLDRLVSDMSELSKLQSGVIEVNRDNFDLKKCVDNVVLLLSKAINEKNINLVMDLDDSVVYADEIKISQVIYNYLSNALKYSDDNSKIIIRSKADEEKVRLEVIDNGSGISEEALPYIWDRYYKVDKNFNRSVNSTGLGLAIAKAILEAHNAKYGVESTVGEGSTFWFELSKDYDEED